mmetsp:Transcript_63071/g.146895  ORF Transcript_63071/g.146895 Transcript_63071/m.146895 type:complete len:85 (-) Transcript_63071:742-996(-)
MRRSSTVPVLAARRSLITARRASVLRAQDHTLSRQQEMQQQAMLMRVIGQDLRKRQKQGSQAPREKPMGFNRSLLLLMNTGGQR